MRNLPAGNPIRILIVDDSVFMRMALRRMLESDPAVEVVGVAKDGVEALDQVEALRPDLVTLDIEMPRMDGLTVLEKIMSRSSLPVIMISSHTQEGSRATLRALDLGAVDFIPKSTDGSLIGADAMEGVLLEKVKACAASQVRPRWEEPSPPLHRRTSAQGPPAPGPIDVVAIGASTGGPRALKEVISRLPGDFPAAVLIVQHMPQGFTRTFAERLNEISEVMVKEAEEGDAIVPGGVLVAPGGQHLLVRTRAFGGPVVRLTQHPGNLSYRPSVDVMLCAVAEVFGERALAVMMTGMGYDGREGMRAIKKFGGRTLAQDRESCVVFGMPGAAAAIGVVDQMVPLWRLAETLVGVVLAAEPA